MYIGQIAELRKKYNNYQYKTFLKLMKTDGYYDILFMIIFKNTINID